MARTRALAAACLACAGSALNLRCEGSGRASKLLSRQWCKQVDEATVDITVDATGLAGGGEVHLLPGVADLAVDLHAAGQNSSGGDDGVYPLNVRFVNEAGAESTVWIYFMKTPTKIGHFVRSLAGGSFGTGTATSHTELAWHHNVFRLTTRRSAMGPEFERCGKAALPQAPNHCTSWSGDISRALEERRYQDVVGIYELLSRSCVVRTGEDNVHELIPRVHPGVEVSGPKLRHDALQLRHLVAANRTPGAVGLRLATHFERVAEVLDATFGNSLQHLEEMYSHPQVHEAMQELEPENATLSVACHLNRGVKRTMQRDWGDASVLHNSTDFDRVLEDFWTKGVAVIDNVLSPEALEEFQRYLLEEARYTKVRAKYMEASPPTFQPRVLASLAQQLEARLPDIFGFGDVHLKRWWAFQQVDGDEEPNSRSNATAQTGVDMHADSAMVSLNLFATPDEARLSGGGLHIWRVLPGGGTGFDSYNKLNWEAEEKARILAHKKETVAYKYNRAALFMSDLFHETEDFAFRPGHHRQRINVAVLWGDKAPSGTLFNRRPKQFVGTASIPHIEL